MAHQHNIQSLSQNSTAEEYTQPFILHSIKPLLSPAQDHVLSAAIFCMAGSGCFSEIKTGFDFSRCNR
jgi:hypothetical protein